MAHDVPAVRSTVAVSAGFFTSTVLSLGGDLLLRSARPEAFDAAGRIQSSGVLVVVLLYVAVFSTLGGYLTAHLAQRKYVAHALALGGISMVLALIVTVLAWGTAPAWYHITALLLIFPTVLLGAKIRQLQVG